ncbi:hypothetical protein [Altererythrobacter sp. ZODW24]|uniref:hypothetical protein n=1 Tax=Altererythrobacter sp. ZODW24 TaxID=2185142 RepID=UPI000DF82E87|nr:hypothetical protein [Altererythrobacter sp. ZODW24]
MLTDFDNGTFGTANGQPDQSPSVNPYPGQIDSGQFAYFYSFFHGAFGFVANAQTPRNTYQHPGITDPVYGASGYFFASDPNTTTPTINFAAQNVVPDQNYQVSFWAANSEPNGTPNNINLEIDGITSLNTGPLQAFNAALEWKLYSYVFNAGNRTEVLFALRSLETGAGGRDFYLDNVELRQCNIAGGDISGTVYSDVNGNNAYQSATEAGIGSIRVDLYDDRGTASTTDDLFVSSYSSAAAGTFMFNNVPANNNYRVRVLTNDPDLPYLATFGTTQNLLASLASGGTVTGRDFGFDLPPPVLSVSKTSEVYAEQGLGVFAIPGQDLAYTIAVTNSGGGGQDANSNFLVDSLPASLTFYNADFDGAGTLTSDPVYFTQSGAGLSFNYATDVRFSNSVAPPSSFTACDYTPTATYDPAVRHICVNPKGTVTGSASTSGWAVKFRAQIK